MSSVLYHHGILGQRWGVRRYQNSDGTLTSQGRQRYGKTLDKANKSDQNEKSKRGLTDKQKKAIKIGIAAAATATLVIGGVYLYQSGKLDGLVETGKNKVDKLLGKATGAKTPLTQKTGSNLSPSDAIIGRNPSGSKDNCKNVAMAVARAHNGYGDDLIASSDFFSGDLHEYMGNAFDNSKVFSVNPNGDRALMKSQLTRQILKRYSDGDVGIVSIGVDKKFSNDGEEHGHAFNFFVQNGKVLFKDGQPNPPLQDASSIVFDAMDASKEIEFCRIDDSLIPREGALDKIMQRG